MSLSFREKNVIAKELSGDKFISTDKELLRKHFPNSKLLNRSPGPSRPDLSFDILFLLLDFESIETIQNNRIGMGSDQKPIEKAPKFEMEQKVPVKKKSQKKKNTKTSSGPILKAKMSGMLTQSIQTGCIAIGGCANWIRSLI